MTLRPGEMVRIEGDLLTEAQYEVLKVRGDRAHIRHDRTGETEWVPRADLERTGETLVEYQAKIRAKLSGDKEPTSGSDFGRDAGPKLDAAHGTVVGEIEANRGAQRFEPP